jgi:hypothetical protein
MKQVISNKYECRYTTIGELKDAIKAFVIHAKELKMYKDVEAFYEIKMDSGEGLILETNIVFHD